MLTDRQINKDILKIALPNILGNISIALIGLVDTYLMGHEENSDVLLGAIGLSSILFNLIYWNFGFLRVATTGITAQAFGEKNVEKQALTFFRAIVLGFVVALLIFLFRNQIADFGFQWIENDTNQDAIPYAKEYFLIRILAVPAVLLLFGFRGWFYGMQNAIYPFVLTTVVNVVNVIASIYFVKKLNLSIAGVAWGTVLSQYICLIIAVLLFFKYKWVGSHFSWTKIFVKEQISRFFKVSGFVFGRNIMLSLVFSYFAFFSSTVGKTYLAANQILLQFFYMMSFAVDGFAYASEALVGKYVGSKNFSGVQRVIKWTMIWGIGFGILYAILYQLFGVEILGKFTNDQEIINRGKPFIIWLSLIAIAGSFAFIWDGIFIGATYVEEMFASMTIASIAYFVLYFVAKTRYPEHAIWIAMFSYMLVRGSGQWLFYSIKKRGSDYSSS